MAAVRYRTDARAVHLLSWRFAVRGENPVTQTILLIQGGPAGAVVVREALGHATDGAFALDWAATWLRASSAWPWRRRGRARATTA